ncbi:Mannose-6-phosphate isomerase [Rhizoclosmatium sp. JEL0117]|nr:Mannose-6-phosphate isomerase [Rhizoclosmatium sp. JEL0117]
MDKLSSFSLRQSTPTKDVERMIQLIVRFGDGDDLSVRVAASSSVLELKALIGEWKQALAAKYLRLVYRGRILHDSMALATLVPMATDVYSASTLSDTPLYLHCAVSDAPVSDRQEPQMNANEPALGFDRLIDVGFSRQEVANLRTQFHSIRGRDEQHDLTRTAEEAWIDNDNRPRPDSGIPPFKNSTSYLRFTRLRVKTQPYEWGKLGMDSKAGQLASADPSTVIAASTPYAELWMGTHPNAPSLVWDTSVPLKAALTSTNLSPAVSAKFDADLPFLFKVLSVNKALSIQAHPDKQLARFLFEKRPDLYKDPNHKPEMAVALTDFEALIGFRPLSEIQHHLVAYPELRACIDDTAYEAFSQAPSKASLKLVFASLMQRDPALVATQIRDLITRLATTTAEAWPVGTLNELLIRLDSQYPNDVGVFCALLLNFVRLKEGQGIFLAANEPHAYLSGDIIECMAASDNVVRSGLTPKFKDVNTLVDMLTYNNGSADSQILNGVTYNHGKTSLLYDPPIDEFSIIRTKLGVRGEEHFSGLAGPSILLVTEGNGSLVVDGEEVVAGCGFVFFVGAGVEVVAKGGDGGVTMYRAYCVV